MGIVGISNIDLTIDNEKKGVKGITSRSQSEIKVFEKPKELSYSSETTIALKKTNPSAIKQSLEKIIDNEEKKSNYAKSSSLISKIKNLFGISSDECNIDNKKILMTDSPIDIEMRKLYELAIKTLKSKNIDFNELTKEEKLSYLSALADFKYKNISAEKLIKTRTEIQKGILERNKLNKVTKYLPSFIQEYYTSLFVKVGDFSNGTREIVIKTASDDAVKTYIFVDASTIEKTRLELLDTIMKSHQDINNKNIKKIIIKASEAKTDKEISEMKKIIQSRKIKMSKTDEEKLFKILETQLKLKKINTRKAINFYCNFVDEKRYNDFVIYLKKHDVINEKLANTKKKLNEKLESEKILNNELKEKKYYLKNEIKTLKNNFENFTSNDMRKYKELKNEEKKLKQLSNKSEQKIKAIEITYNENAKEILSINSKKSDMINSMLSFV